MKKMSMLDHIGQAWSKKCNLTEAEYDSEFDKMLAASFKNFNHPELADDFQNVIIYLIFSDDTMYPAEYAEYKHFNEIINVPALSKEEIQNKYRSINDDEILNSIKRIKALRAISEDDVYESFVLSLCYLAYSADNDIGENEFNIISSFYEFGFDEVPATYKDFFAQFNK